MGGEGGCSDSEVTRSVDMIPLFLEVFGSCAVLMVSMLICNGMGGRLAAPKTSP